MVQKWSKPRAVATFRTTLDVSLYDVAATHGAPNGNAGKSSLRGLGCFLRPKHGNPQGNQESNGSIHPPVIKHGTGQAMENESFISDFPIKPSIYRGFSSHVWWPEDIFEPCNDGIAGEVGNLVPEKNGDDLLTWAVFKIPKSHWILVGLVPESSIGWLSQSPNIKGSTIHELTIINILDRKITYN